jgi:hypothetical protein
MLGLDRNGEDQMAVATGSVPGARDEGENKLHRDVGLVGLLFASVGSIIGSGWLFGALSASTVAGPAAVRASRTTPSAA